LSVTRMVRLLKKWRAWKGCSCFWLFYWWIRLDIVCILPMSGFLQEVHV
jgi:hypothetical protein